MADALLGIVPNPNLQNLIDWFVKLIARPLYDAAGNETSIIEPMKQFSTPGIASFNAKYTDGPGVEYFSIGGRSDRHLGGTHCATANAPPFISAYNLALDPIDPLLNPTEIYLTGGITSPYPNDGLVRVADSKWGTFLGCIPADHFDEIGHLFGDLPGLINPFRHKPFYRHLVQFLRGKGY